MKNRMKFTNKTLKIILTLLLIVGQFGISTRKISAEDYTQINSWADLVAAAENGGNYILMKDIAAEGSITVSREFNLIGDNGDNKNKTISQKQRDSYDSLFKVENGGSLTLGTGLTLSGKVSQCGPGSATAIEATEENTHKLTEFEVTETAKNAKAKFITVEGYKLANTSGNEIDLETRTQDGYEATEFEIVGSWLKLNGQYVYSYGTGNYQLNMNTDRALRLVDPETTNFVTDIEENGSYLLHDPYAGGYLKWDDQHGLVSGGGNAEAIVFKANGVTPGSTGGNYWEIPIGSGNKFKNPDEENQAEAALKEYNTVRFKHVPGADLTVITNKYYYYAEQDKWVNSGGKTIDEAMAQYNAAHPSCSLKCPNEVDAYTSDTFNGDIENYKPKGFFVHVEAGGSATLEGAILEDFITNRTKDKSPKYVAPVVAVGDTAVFNIESGEIKNNVVGYIVEDKNANESADKIKKYVKGAAPNAARVGEYATKQYRRNVAAGIDGGNAGSGITATAGAVIYANGAKGDITGGSIQLNRGDTGGIMATGTGTKVNLKDGTNINKNVGVQFGGGVTTEQGAFIAMTGGNIHENVAWFGGGGVFATENGVEWLLGKLKKDKPEDNSYDNYRKDGIFVMDGGTIEANTAFTRGGGFLVDSDGVNLIKGVIKNNMSRMLGGGMYVMGDHPDFTYTVYINEGYVHENKAVSAGPKNSVATDADNQILSRKLVAPECCNIGVNLFDGQMEVNSDDLNDGYPGAPHDGSDGTGGGIWLCAYGNTVLNVDDENFIIDNNRASGSVVRGKAKEDNQVQEQISSDKAGGNDIHKETKGPGNVVIFGIKDNSVKWYDENTGEWYTDPANAVDHSITDFSLKNLTNVGEFEPSNYSAGNYSGVDVFGNISRRGGGLAADGTFMFGKAEAMGEAYSELAVTKKWAGGVTPEDVTIRIQLQYEEDGNEKTLDVIELPLSDVVNPDSSELDTVFTDGLQLDDDGNPVEYDGNPVYIGHIVLPITVEDENGKQIQLFDLLADSSIDIDKIGRNEEGKKETIPAGYEFKLNEAYGLIALGRYLKEGGTVTLSNAKRKLTFVEVKYDENGNEVEVEGYELTPSEMKISGDPTFHEEYITQLQTDGTEKQVGTVITSDVRFEAGLYNDKPAEIDKYINKAVHQEIELDDVFEYDVIAYVKHGTDKLIIEDTLVDDLEFVSGDVKVVSLDENNHLVVNDIYGNLVDVDNKASVNQDGTEITNKEVVITDNKLTVTIENELEEVKDADGNVIGYKNADDNQHLKELWGKWVKVTYKAQIKQEYQDEIKSGLKSLSDLKYVTIQADAKYKDENSIFEGDEERPEPNVGNAPVESEESHNGIINTASYSLEVKNEGAFRDESNTVTVKPNQPEIEKYVNTAVHKDILIDEIFKYDIIAYVTNDADKVIITDDLIDSLELVVDDNHQVLVYDLDSENNHKVAKDIKDNDVDSDASVLKGNDITDLTTITAENKGSSLEVVIENIDGGEQNATKLRGHYVRVEFYAQIKEELQKKVQNKQMSVEDLPNVKITENKPVKSEEEHDGLDNTASYVIEVGNESKYKSESNTVTVKPKEYIDIEVTKTWDDIDNLEELRPSEVIVNLMANGDIVASATISEKDGWKYVFKDIEKGPEYTIEEEVVSYYVAEITGDVEEGFEIINHYRSYLPGKRKITSEETGEFTLSKTAEENVSKEIEFTFKVKMLIEEEGSETRTFEETVKLKVGESKTYDFVAEGTEVEIVEVDANNYEITYYLEDAIISKPIFVVEKDGQHAFNVHNKIKPARKPSVPTTGVK